MQVQEYKDSLKQKAEHLIIKGFPEKIVKLNELLEKSNFQNRDLADVHQVNPNVMCMWMFLTFTGKTLNHKVNHQEQGIRHDLYEYENYTY